MPDAPDLDSDLLQSLELFNSHLQHTADDEKAAKIVAKAERRKDEAAARVRKLNQRSDASAEEQAEAEAAYRNAIAEVAARTDDPFGKAAAESEPAPDSDGSTGSEQQAAPDDTTDGDDAGDEPTPDADDSADAADVA